jgi:hypothetical protein
MAASLSRAEHTILVAICDSEGEDPRADRFTDLVRRRAGQLTGPEYRRGVAGLADRGLLQATVVTKSNGDIGRVVIRRITLLGRRVIGR